MNRLLPSGRARLAPGILAVLVAALLAAGTPALGAPRTASMNAALAEFNAICFDLTQARLRLQEGIVSDEAFGDVILALFLRADSLASELAGMPQAGHGPFGLQRGTSYLIESLRENWEGIAARNGMSFAEADAALKAAVAWKSSDAEMVVTASGSKP